MSHELPKSRSQVKFDNGSQASYENMRPSGSVRRNLLGAGPQESYYGADQSSLVLKPMKPSESRRQFGSRRMTHATDAIQVPPGGSRNFQTTEQDRGSHSMLHNNRPPLGPSPHQPAQWNKGVSLQGADKMINNSEMKITSNRG